MVVRDIINDKDVRDNLRALKKVPKWTRKEMMNWGKSLQTGMRISAGHAGSWTGRLKESIKWVNDKRGGHLEMSLQGVQLDRARPHKVSLRKNKARNIRLAEWAIAHGRAKMVDGVIQPGGMWVHPHPFITRTLNKHLTKIDKRLKRVVGKIK